MPKLINGTGVVENTQQVLEKDFSGKLSVDNAIVPLDYLLENTSILNEFPNTGVWLDSEQGPESLEPLLAKLTVIAINFPKFGDGRGYSYARILRDRLGYTGEIRAIGDVLHDQLFYLKRCGFDAFAIRDDKDAEVAKQGLDDFTNSYQAATIQPKPLFRRR